MSRAYNNSDEVVVYTWRDDLFGPMVTDEEILALEFRAVEEGWQEWLNWILATKSKRKRRWLLAYMRDDVIKITIESQQDPLGDDDPWEVDR